MSEHPNSELREKLAKKLARALKRELLNEFQLSQLTTGSANEAIVRQLQEEAVTAAFTEVPVQELYRALVSGGAIEPIDTAEADKEAWLDSQASEAEASEDLEEFLEDFTDQLYAAGKTSATPVARPIVSGSGSGSGVTHSGITAKGSFTDEESGVTSFSYKAGKIGTLVDVTEYHMVLFEVAVGHWLKTYPEASSGEIAKVILAVNGLLPKSRSNPNNDCYSAKTTAALLHALWPEGGLSTTDHTMASYKKVSKDGLIPKIQSELVQLLPEFKNYESSSLPEFKASVSQPAVVGHQNKAPSVTLIKGKKTFTNPNSEGKGLGE